jgi:WD40 repeat protein
LTKSIRLWDVATGTVKAEHKLGDFQLSQIAVSPDGSLLAVAGVTPRLNGDGVALPLKDDELTRRMLAILVLDAKTGRCLQQLEHHRHLVTAVDFSRDGSRLVSSGRDGTMVIWKRVK